MIPVSSIEPTDSLPPRLAIESLEDILPGPDPGFDVICEGILTGGEFLYQPEMAPSIA